MIVFESAGISSLQDLGRPGLQNQGIGACGVMDRMAARVANNLLGNADNTALIEIALGGTRLRIEQTQWFAITGADLNAEVDGLAIELCRPLRLEAGSLLHFKQPRNGCRAYLAVQGGFEGDTVLGSIATDVRAGLGGYQGRAFQRGDRLAYSPSRYDDKAVRWHTSWANPAFPETGPLPFIPGSHWSWLDERRQEQFLDTAWLVSRNSDRMGLRLALGRPFLTGSARVHALVQFVCHKTVVDEKVLFHRQLRVGALQVAGPVVLDAVAQREVLRAGRRANRVGLHKAQPLHGTGKAQGCEQAAAHSVAAQVGKGR